MRTLASGETDPAIIAQAFRTIPPPGSLAGNMVVLNGSALVPPALLPVGAAATIINGVITASVGSNALTLAVKTLAGADPSTDDPVLVIFRSATTALGTYVARQITAPLSITAPSGASFNHVSARDQQLIVGALDNGGAVEFTLSCALPDMSTRLRSTTTIGAGSTSASTIYSTIGRSNLPWAPIARIVSNQTTAGTWANGPSASAPGILQIDMAPFTLPVNACRIYLGTNQTLIASTTHTKLNLDTVDIDADSIADLTNRRIQPKVAGIYSVSGAWDIIASGGSLSGLLVISIAQNGTRHTLGLVVVPVCAEAGPNITGLIRMNGTTDYLELQAYVTLTAGTGTAQGLNTITFLSCQRVGP